MSKMAIRVRESIIHRSSTSFGCIAFLLACAYRHLRQSIGAECEKEKGLAGHTRLCAVSGSDQDVAFHTAGRATQELADKSHVTVRVKFYLRYELI